MKDGRVKQFVPLWAWQMSECRTGPGKDWPRSAWKGELQGLCGEDVG